MRRYSLIRFTVSITLGAIIGFSACYYFFLIPSRNDAVDLFFAPGYADIAYLKAIKSGEIDQVESVLQRSISNRVESALKWYSHMPQTDAYFMFLYGKFQLMKLPIPEKVEHRVKNLSSERKANASMFTQ